MQPRDGNCRRQKTRRERGRRRRPEKDGEARGTSRAGGGWCRGDLMDRDEMAKERREKRGKDWRQIRDRAFANCSDHRETNGTQGERIKGQQKRRDLQNQSLQREQLEGSVNDNYRSRSSADVSSQLSRHATRSPMRTCSPSSASPTSVRQRDSLRDERQLSPTMSPAAATKRNPSAGKLAPFSIARISESGRRCRAVGVSPRSPVRKRTSYQ